MSAKPSGQSFPPLIPVAKLWSVLPEIFPESTAQRSYVIREMAAKTIFTMIYAGAIENSGRWIRPDQVTKMTNAQARKADFASRESWSVASVSPGKMSHVAGRWYSVNTREPIRDETLRNGLVPAGAVIERKNLPTTSSAPRYALSKSFYELLVALVDKTTANLNLLGEWQKTHLGAGALARAAIFKKGALLEAQSDRITIKIPGRGDRHLMPGPSAVITKAIVEVFTKRFLAKPAVVLISQSAEKIDPQDQALARQLGLQIESDRNLPDLVLFDAAEGAEKLIFVEVVASDGAVTPQRKAALMELVKKARFATESVFFVTAFPDRTSAHFKRLASEIAWDTFAWFVSEPDNLIIFKENAQLTLGTLK